MGRRRVRPSERQRNVQACIPCQKAKRRCSSDLPCSQCVKHNREPQCIYKQQPPGSTRALPSEHPLPHRSSPGALDSDQRLTIPLNAPHPLLGDQTELSTPQTDAHSSVSAEPSEATVLTQPRLLTNSRGKDVYVGKTAIIAFLPLLRDIFRHFVGSSKFTDSTSNNTMLETAPTETNLASSRNEVGYLQKKDLIGLFFAASSGILDILEPSDVLQSLETIEFGLELDENRRVCLDLVIAIGAKCHSNALTFATCEEFHILRSRQTLNLEMLEDVSLDTVRIFLLLAFYMCCACRRNEGYMYLGVAARAAHIIGIHNEDFLSIAGKGDPERLKLWKSLRVLESLVSSFLGRPSATSGQTSNHQLPNSNHLDLITTRSFALDATYRLLATVDTVVDNMYGQKNTSASAASEMLTKLTDWSINLPYALKLDRAGPGSEPFDQDLVLGKIHVSCSYYFAVMLITRPYFMHHMLTQLSLGARGNSEEVKWLPRKSTIPASSDISTLAKTCEDAAVLMLNDCNEVLTANLMLSNMCLLQAWVFAAALILGLVMFTKDEVKMEIPKAFDSAIAVLQKLATRSPQAGHYHEIISDLLVDINKRHRQLEQQRQQSSTPLVTKLFEVKSSTQTSINEVPGPGLEPANQLYDDPLSGENDNWATFLPSALTSSWQGVDHHGLSLGWENLALQSWHEFPDSEGYQFA